MTSKFAEITIIGTGGGYGESVVINLGDNYWVVVDSCMDPISKKSLTIEYLENSGVNISLDVKLILCTHWHDDHIKGISKLLEKATSSQFCFTQVTDIKKFIQLIKMDFNKRLNNSLNSSTIEFNECLEILKSRGVKPIYAMQDRLIYKNNDAFVYSLTPSDLTLENFNLELNQILNKEFDNNVKIIAKKPNNKSIVLYLKIGKHSAILGADLEVTKNPLEGWENILSNCLVINTKSSLFKIPHHGSENAYHQMIWSQLLHEDPISLISPWNLNNKLPQSVMVQKYCNHSKYVYLTSNVVGHNKSKPREKSIEKLIKNLNIKLKEEKFNKGVVKSIIDINDQNAKWITVPYFSAFHINPSLD